MNKRSHAQLAPRPFQHLVRDHSNTDSPTAHDAAEAGDRLSPLQPRRGEIEPELPALDPAVRAMVEHVRIVVPLPQRGTRACTRARTRGDRGAASPGEESGERARIQPARPNSQLTFAGRSQARPSSGGGATPPRPATTSPCIHRHGRRESLTRAGLAATAGRIPAPTGARGSGGPGNARASATAVRAAATGG